MKEAIIQALTTLESKTISKLYRSMLKFGLRNGLIRPYEASLIENLRTVSFGGMPLSIILLLPNLCEGHCNDRAITISMGLNRFNIVWGSVRSIRSNPEVKSSKLTMIEYSDHTWVESDGWVYDTSSCYMARKWFYYLMEGPIVRRRKDHNWCRQQEYYQEQHSREIEKDKYWMPLIIPLIEPQIPGSLYEKLAAIELELFKESIGYDQIYAEVKADMEAKGFR